MIVKLAKAVNITQIQRLLITYCFSLVFLAYACFAENIPDITNYQMHYETLSMHKIEWFYWLLMKLSKDCGLSFFQFRAVCYLFSIILLNISISKFVKNKFIVYLLCLIYPFFIDIIQTRNFMAMSLLTYGITCLTNIRNKYSKIYFTLVIVLAAGIQAVSYFYFALLIVDNKPRKHNYMTLLGLVMFFTFGCVLPFQDIIITLLSKHINDYRITYLDYKTNFGFYLFVMLNFGHSILMIWAVKLLRTTKIYCDKKFFSFINIMTLASIVLFMIVPLYLYTTLFYRIMRNILPLSHVMCYMVIKYTKSSFDKMFFILCYVLFITFVGVTQFYIPHYSAFINILNSI